MHCLTNKYKKAARSLLQSPAAPAPSRREPMLRQVICSAARWGLNGEQTVGTGRACANAKCRMQNEK